MSKHYENGTNVGLGLVEDDETDELLSRIKELSNDNADLKEKLKVAVECLKQYSDTQNWDYHKCDDEKPHIIAWIGKSSHAFEIAKNILAKIGEI